MNKPFKIDDRVWSPLYGFGIVMLTSERKTMIKLENGGLEVSSLIDGRINEADVAPIWLHADEIPEFYKTYAVDPRIGKWGYFWDVNAQQGGAHYSILTDIKDSLYLDSTSSEWTNFSLEIPEHCK